MPVPVRNGIFHIGTAGLPACPRELIFISIIAIIHYIIYTNTAVAIIIIITLPDISVAVYCRFIVVPEVIAQAFYLRTVRVATEYHSFPVFARTDFISILVKHHFTFFVF